MLYYRVSREDYQIGDRIYPNPMYIDFVQGAKLKAEQVLEQARPADKPDRNNTVKLFDSLDAARRYWVFDINSKIYQVNVLPEEIRHKGNYSMYIQIAQAEGEEQISAIVLGRH